MKPLAQLTARLAYEFSDIDLARAALTHRSAGGKNNERLEFLGDALLDLVISEQLYHLRPQANEGDLSRLRASLVRRDALARLAGELDLGDYLALGPGELRSGGYRRKSILADALEALLGAIYLDGGYTRASEVVLALYRESLEKLPDAAELRDPKTLLQERLQARGLDRPEYRVDQVAGEAHQQRFTVVCQVSAFDVETRGEGSSRRRAEQAAARAALDEISDEPAA